MAHCVISAVFDTDAGQMMPACLVHSGGWAPCPHDGQPASSIPLHSHDRPSRRAAVRFWESRTHGQRTLVLHHGWFGDEREHATGASDLTCWCQPELLPAPAGARSPLAVP